MKNKVNRIFKKLVLYSVYLSVTVIMLELLLRVLPGYRFDVLVNSVARIQSSYHAKCYRPSKLFGFELIPNAIPQINSFGMRDKEYNLKKSENVFRILVLGDSITEQGSWSSRVEEKLNKRGKYELLNCGVSAWGLENYHSYLKYKGLEFKPDLVLIGLCLNDMPPV